jgi:hypothetical protein
MAGVGFAQPVRSGQGSIPAAIPPVAIEVAPPEFLKVPYGMAYFDGQGAPSKPMRAYPTLAADMHAFGQPAPAELMDERKTREAWRVSIWNNSSHKVDLRHIRMVRDSYSPLPARYVCAWAPKGQANAPAAASIYLHAADTEWALPDFKPLEPNDSALIDVKVVAADPGVYRLHVAFEFSVGKGQVSPMSSSGVELFVPDRLAAHGAFFIQPPSHRDDVAWRVLRLSPPLFDSLVKESAAVSWRLDRAPDAEIVSALQENDEAFMRRLRSWRDLSSAL